MPTEGTLRNRAKRLGYCVHKERNRQYPGDRYMIVDKNRAIVAGCDHGVQYTMSLEDVEDWLRQQQ